MKRNILILMLVVWSTQCFTQTYSGNVVACEGAWCWFADPRALHYNNDSGTINMSYIGYIDVHGNVKATQYNWLTGEKQDVLVRSNFQPDDHNNPTFLILPDERVLIIYSRHTDERAFYYRVSLHPGDITMLGEEKCLVTEQKTTYPSPFILSDDPTHWYMCWRGINWHPTIARLTIPDEEGDCSFDWGPYQIVQGPAERPYAKYYSNGKDKMYVTYTTGHPDNESPNWVYFNVININGGGEPTLEDIRGKKLSTIKNGPFQIAKTDSYKNSYPNTVVDAPTGGIRDWVWQIALDENESPRIAMVRISSDKKQHEYYYARWIGTRWALTDICSGGGKFHLSNTEYCYSGGEALDPQNPNVMYVSRPTDGTYGAVFEIWKYTLNDSGKVVDSEPVTQNSLKNNVRPFIMPGSQNSPMRLLWMNGDYYHWIVSTGHPEGFPTSIVCDYDWNALHQAQSAAKGWTISTNITMQSDRYYGELLHDGDIEYTLNRQTLYPEITVAGQTFKSQNILYTSDGWALSCPSGSTDGKNYPSKLTEWNLTITYDSLQKILTTYRNGLIDQCIQLEKELPAPATALDGCQPQQQIQHRIESQVFRGIYVPAQTSADIVLPYKIGGETIKWSSSNEEVLTPQGIYKRPKSDTYVSLTASTLHCDSTFTLLVKAYDICQNLLASYDFESHTNSKVSDKSGRGNDLTLMGSAKLDGTLNLTANTQSGFKTNGYALLPAVVMDSLRSYTILVDITPQSLNASPRIYDFGWDSGNSMFLRANKLSAGIKYSGGTTTLTHSSQSLEVGKTYKIAVTYDAEDHTTCIYVDGQLAASGRENVNEPYLISQSNSCVRNYIGRTQWWDTSYSGDNADFKGTIDNFMMYNTVLSLSDICKLQDIPYIPSGYKTSFDNGDFEASYSVMQNSGVESDRAIHVPEGWTLDYSPRDPYDITALQSGDLYYSNFFADKRQCPDAGQHTFWIRQRWAASILDYSQNVLLPAGEYTLTAQVYSSGSNSDNKAYVYVDGNRKSPSAKSVWQTVSFVFWSDGETPLRIGFMADHTADEFICGFDNFALMPNQLDGITSVIVPSNHAAVYSLDGRVANLNTKGIIIRGGKKYWYRP
ncbi:MAG: BNR-4 repeat-containing protein [Bacteroidaceae bacterium]|nr:BNR-4 repeat-containing protein [Bacteroidaceae bacterium]